MDKKLIELVDKALTRRSFMASSSVAAAAAFVAGCGGGSTPAPTPTPTPTPAPASFTDTDYLNFALNLEYLEAVVEHVSVALCCLDERGYVRMMNKPGK